MSITKFVYSEIRREVRKDHYFFNTDGLREIQSKVKEYVESDHFPHPEDDGTEENWGEFLKFNTWLMERNDKRVASLIKSVDLVYSKVIEAIKHEPYILCPPAMKDLATKIEEYINSKGFPHDEDKGTTKEQWEAFLKHLSKEIESAEEDLKLIVELGLKRLKKEEEKLPFVLDIITTVLALGMCAWHCLPGPTGISDPEKLKAIRLQQSMAPYP